MVTMDFDAIVVGSGPNGLAAAITLQREGKNVLLVEARQQIGGGMRTQELTLPGFRHDVCSAIHPMAGISPFFKTIPMERLGLAFVHPPFAAAHPFDHEPAAFLHHSIQETAAALGGDAAFYQKTFGPLAENFPLLINDILGPLKIPAHPVKYASFGLNALLSAKQFAGRFQTERAKGLWAGMAAHAIQPLSNLTTAAIGLVLMTAGHTSGWPVPVGGSQSIADALLKYFLELGGKVETGFHVTSLSQLPSAHTVLFDVTPKQLLQIAGHTFSPLYKWQLERYRYGMGVFKIDWALDGPIPFKDEVCRQAGTIHIGNTFREIEAGEKLASEGGHPEKPYVLLAQQSIFDSTRAPEGKQVAWAYCHVPNGSTKDMTAIIEAQVERFAPGFKDRILARHTMNAMQMEIYNPNYVGGDINGGILDIGQLFTRPALRRSPYKTSKKGLYICSSSTPPGGGVHGMCGYHAAKAALKDVFS